EQPALVLHAEVAPAADPAGADDAVHRQERREVAAGAERACGAGGPRPPRERRQLPVGHDLAARHLPELARAGPVEPGRQDELDVGKVVVRPFEPRRQPSGKDMSRDSPWAGPFWPGELAVKDAAAV